MSTEPQERERPAPTILDAVRFLAGRCDWAAALDGNGFNKFDAEFGHSLADCERLTPKQEVAALKMLQKYRRQLANGGIDYYKLGAATRVENNVVYAAPATRRIELSGTRFVLVYPYDPDLIAEIKRLPDRKFHGKDNPWNGRTKVWTMPLDRCLEVEEFAKRFDFAIPNLKSSKPA